MLSLRVATQTSLSYFKSASHILSRISRIQRRFSTWDTSDLIINVAWGFKFVPWSYGSFWAHSTFETSLQCLQDVLNEHLWADQMLRLQVKCPDSRPTPRAASLSWGLLEQPASIRHWARSHCACSGSCCHFPPPTVCPSQFSWTATKPGLNSFSGSPHPLHTLHHWLPKKDHRIIES